jgi:hypothetical protein
VFFTLDEICEECDAFVSAVVFEDCPKVGAVFVEYSNVDVSEGRVGRSGM